MTYTSDLMADRLKSARTHMGFSQQEVANSLGIHVTGYNKYEVSKASPSPTSLCKLAELYNVDMNYFFSPDMTIDQASMLSTKQESLLSRLDKIVSSMETKLQINGEDSLSLLLIERPAFARLARLISKESDETLNALEGLIYGFLASHKK